MSKIGTGSSRKFSSTYGIRIPKAVAEDSNSPFTFDGQKVWVSLEEKDGVQYLIVSPDEAPTPYVHDEGGGGVCGDDDSFFVRDLLKDADELRKFPMVDISGKFHMGDLYFVRCENTNFIKIGYSTDVERRISDMNVSNPLKLTAIKVLKDCGWMESIYHGVFRTFRKRGEWFDLSDNAIAYIEELKGDT